MDGWIVVKPPRNPPHDTALGLANAALWAWTPAGWYVRVQCAITTTESEPEPDLAVVRGNPRTHATTHPGPADIALVVEVANTMLAADSGTKLQIYARAGIAVFCTSEPPRLSTCVLIVVVAPPASPSQCRTGRQRCGSGTAGSIRQPIRPGATARPGRPAPAGQPSGPRTEDTAPTTIPRARPGPQPPLANSLGRPLWPRAGTERFGATRLIPWRTTTLSSRRGWRAVEP